MADTPIWVTLTTPVVAAFATWATTKLDLLSFGKLNKYEGDWYAYYCDPDDGIVEEELWRFSKFGGVTVSQNSKITFKGRLTLTEEKAYMQVRSVDTGEERLLIMLDRPKNPRNRGTPPCKCLWLGQNKDGVTTAGHGLISRAKQPTPKVVGEFIQAR